MTAPTPPHHRLVPTNVAALAVGVSEATIRKWVSRGKITRYGAPNCRSGFDIDELTEIAKLRHIGESPKPTNRPHRRNEKGS